ncbi:MAG: OadG family transporter subunit [Bacillota bacterium]
MIALEFTKLGIETTVIGVGVVFIVLIILSLLIKGLSFLDDFFASRTNDTQSGTPPSSEHQGTIVNKENAVHITPVESRNSNSTAISPTVVAAIMGAVCMMTGRSVSNLKLTSIKRAGNGQALWSAMGTNEIIVTRQRFLERGIK